jgi:membrane-associated HD superfamily phosphohydrolase
MMKIKGGQILLNIKKNLPALLDIFRTGPNLFSAALCIIAAVVIIASSNDETIRDIGNFETGRVADRDVIASISVTFVDEEATRIRQEIAVKQIHAVFSFSDEASANIFESWKNFCDYMDNFTGAQTLENPGDYPDEIIHAYLTAADAADIRKDGIETLNKLLNRGVFSFNAADVRSYNSEFAELERIKDGGIQRDIISYDDMITMANVKEAIAEIISIEAYLLGTVTADI